MYAYRGAQLMPTSAAAAAANVRQYFTFQRYENTVRIFIAYSIGIAIYIIIIWRVRDASGESPGFPRRAARSNRPGVKVSRAELHYEFRSARGIWAFRKWKNREITGIDISVGPAKPIEFSDNPRAAGDAKTKEIKTEHARYYAYECIECATVTTRNN